MENINKTDTYPLFSFGLIIFTVILSIINIYLKNDILLMMMPVILVFIMISYMIFIKKLNNYILLLVEITQNIIDQDDKKFPYLDGESSIAVLYSHLSILDTRIKNLIDTLKKEQQKLKGYIEDISHQIKTPLTAMILKEEMLLEHEQNDILLSIYHSTEKVQYLIESLLRLAQIESHTITYKKENYDLQGLIVQVEDQLSALLEYYQVCIHYQLDNHIYCDEDWMSEALENILKNCIERGNNVDITTKDTPSYIEIYIHDDGCGFEQKDLPHLFEKFYKGESQGVGIGLSLAKAIISDHHGTIEAYNQSGAMFKITLPHKITKNKVIVTK